MAAPTYSAVVLADSPASYWRMNEAFGSTTAVDQQGVINIGSLTFGDFGRGNAIDGMCYSAGAPAGTTSSTSLYSFVGTAAFSIETWSRLRPPFQDATFTMIEKHRTVPSLDGWTLTLYVDDFAKQYTIDFSRWASDAQDAVVFVADSPQGLLKQVRWNHIVGTFDGTTMRLYFNGKPVGEYVALLSLPALTRSITAFGAPSNNVLYDEFAIYSYALSPYQVVTHYGAGLPDPVGLAYSGFQEVLI